mmetsp:Transcript_11815/g.49616  ORF Transcript_11815/g.49616 Transcript_11815/m.49616 type:complete len:226 (+) Transcript_11815:1794-2471(+)
MVPNSLNSESDESESESDSDVSESEASSSVLLALAFLDSENSRLRSSKHSMSTAKHACSFRSSPRTRCSSDVLISSSVMSTASSPPNIPGPIEDSPVRAAAAAAASFLRTPRRYSCTGSNASPSCFAHIERSRSTLFARTCRMVRSGSGREAGRPGLRAAGFAFAGFLPPSPALANGRPRFASIASPMRSASPVEPKDLAATSRTSRTAASSPSESKPSSEDTSV